MSLAAQGLANVRRDHQLVGPVSLYILAVAESGERKSTCDRIFGAALRDWEREQAAACAPAIAAHETTVATAEAKRADLLEAIKRKRRDMQETAEEEAALQELASQASALAKVPRLLYTDATPEALSYAFATGWPSAAVLSAEAGAVFGAHGMGFEAILRNLAQLNVLWDGGAIDIDRRGKASYRLRDRRLTLGLMVQPETMRAFITPNRPSPSPISVCAEVAIRTTTRIHAGFGAVVCAEYHLPIERRVMSMVATSSPVF